MPRLKIFRLAIMSICLAITPLVFHTESLGLKYVLPDLSTFRNPLLFILLSISIFWGDMPKSDFFYILSCIILIYIFKALLNFQLSFIYFNVFMLFGVLLRSYYKSFLRWFIRLISISSVTLLIFGQGLGLLSIQSFINSGLFFNNNLLGGCVSLILIFYHNEMNKELWVLIITILLISNNATAFVVIGYLFFMRVLMNKNMVAYLFFLPLFLVVMLSVLPKDFVVHKFASATWKMEVTANNFMNIFDLNINEILLGAKVLPDLSENTFIDLLYRFGLLSTVFLLIFWLVLLVRFNKHPYVIILGIILLMSLQNSVLTPIGGFVFGMGLINSYESFSSIP